MSRDGMSKDGRKISPMHVALKAGVTERDRKLDKSRTIRHISKLCSKIRSDHRRLFSYLTRNRKKE